MNKKEFLKHIKETGTANLNGISSLTDVDLIGPMQHLDAEGAIVKQQISFKHPLHKVLDLDENIYEDDFRLFVTYEAKNDGEQVYSFFGTVKAEDDTIQFPIIMTLEEVEIFENLIDKAFLKNYNQTFENRWKTNKIFKLSRIIEKEYCLFIAQLKAKPVNEILDCSYEKVFKNEIYAYFADVESTYIADSLNSEQILFLLSLKQPLDFLYQNWCNEEHTYMENLEYSMFGFDVRTDGKYKFGSFKFNAPLLSYDDFINLVNKDKFIYTNAPIDISGISFDVGRYIELDDNLHLNVPIRLKERPYYLFNIGYSMEELSTFKYFINYDAKQNSYLLFCTITDKKGIEAAKFQIVLSEKEKYALEDKINDELYLGCNTIWKMELIQKIHEKMKPELDDFQRSLIGKTSEQIIELSYELTYKKEIYTLLSDEEYVAEEFSTDSLLTLWEIKKPLDFLYRLWLKCPCSVDKPLLDALTNSKISYEVHYE